MKKRLLSLLLSAALLCGALPTAFAGYENFTAKTTYTDGRFSDVSTADWFYENVRASYEYDLVNGFSDGKFHPNENLTIGQAIKLAACLNSLYSSGHGGLCVLDAVVSDLCGLRAAQRHPDPDVRQLQRPGNAQRVRGRSRGRSAARRAPAHQQHRGRRDSGRFCLGGERGRHLSALSGGRADRLDGGRFKPNDPIRRSEVAAIITRMAVAEPGARASPSTRIKPAENVLSADEILAKCGPAVFKLTSYDARGNLLGMGAAWCSPRTATPSPAAIWSTAWRGSWPEMADGTKREVSIYALDADSDIAHIRVVGTGLPYLETASSLSTGDIVYALGYPGGGAEKVTEGQGARRPRTATTSCR